MEILFKVCNFLKNNHFILFFVDMVYKDTLDHYRNFNMLEHYLQLPELFLNQSLLIIDFSIFKELVEKYQNFFLYIISLDIMELLMKFS